MRTPTIEKHGDSLLFLWDDIGIALNYLHERTDGIHGEITITHEAGHIHWARINLSSTTARDSLRKVLFNKTKDDLGGAPYEWEPMIEYACSVAARRHREGEPFVHLGKMLVPPTTKYLLGNMLPMGQTSIIYSQGGSGKSLLSLAIGVAVQSGVCLPGGLTPAKRLQVLYLDYETDEEEQRTRLEWIANGLNLEETPDIICRNQGRSIASDIGRIRREIDEENIGLVIVDSIGYALGGSAMDADIVIDAFNALRSLGNKVTRLAIAHIPKADKDQKVGSIYGSVFFENAGRSVWEMRAELENDGVSMGLFQRKSNWGKRSPPFGLRFIFDDPHQSLAITPHAIEDDSELVTHGTTSFQIINALRTGKRTPKQLALDTGGNIDTIRRSLIRMEKRGQVIAFTPPTQGPGFENAYGIAHANGVAK